MVEDLRERVEAMVIEAHALRGDIYRELAVFQTSDRAATRAEVTEHLRTAMQALQTARARLFNK